MFNDVPEHIQAVIAIAPKAVTITRDGFERWKINYEAPSYTRTRWMDHWRHSASEWMEAIAQVMRD